MTSDVTQADDPSDADLLPLGYAPGFYMGRCQDCTSEQKRDGRMQAKRAWRCREHAVAAWNTRTLADREPVEADHIPSAGEKVEAFSRSTDPAPDVFGEWVIPATEPIDVAELVKDAARYRWLRDKSVPPHNFYISVPDEFAEAKYQPIDVDAYIDAAIAKHGER